MPKTIASKLPAVFLLALTVLLVCGGAVLARQTQAPAGDDQVWKDFIAWLKTAPADADAFRLYGAELAKQGLSKEEIGRRFGIITRLFATKPEGAEVFYDRTFSRPALTGRPEVDGFASVPSEFLMGAVKDVAPGRALDLGMGQGRNAVALAAKGWAVTGVDVSSEAVGAAARNADKAGSRSRGSSRITPLSTSAGSPGTSWP